MGSAIIHGQMKKNSSLNIRKYTWLNIWGLWSIAKNWVQQFRIFGVFAK